MSPGGDGIGNACNWYVPSTSDTTSMMAMAMLVTREFLISRVTNTAVNGMMVMKILMTREF